MNNILVFDIETVADTEAGSKILDLKGLSPADIHRAMVTRQVQKTGTDFLPLHLHRVVAIAVAYCSRDSFKVWSLGDEEAGEQELIQRFYDGIAKFSPTLVSWNGNGFDLPVLHYRALLHGVDAAKYWEMGDDDRDFRFNNYLNRYHWRHIDLMDVLAGFNPRAAAPLNEIAVMLGYPGKIGMDGSKVWDAWLAGEGKKIRDYCETDVLNTYLIYLNWERVRGRLATAQFAARIAQVREYLTHSEQAHFAEFNTAWLPENQEKSAD